MKKFALIIVRGLPGAGKSTIANQSADFVVEADDYFVGDDGVYRFDPKQLGAAHQDCQDRCRIQLEAGLTVAVANTFTQRWEMEPYLKMAVELGAHLRVFDLFDRGLSDEELADRNVHDVPAEAIERMRDRYEHAWWNGNPIPPWER